MTPAELDALVGMDMPGGGFVAEGYEDWLLRDVVVAPHGDDGELHPLWAFIASVRTMGITLERLFELCGSSSADGPMLAGCHIEFAKAFRADQPYSVTASISDAVRKHGRRAGTFDVVTVDVEITDPDGAAVASVRDSYVFPRRSA